jgi:hypothetical protein
MIMVHVDEAVLADPAADGQSRLDEGPEVSAEASRRLACDAAVVQVTHKEDGGIDTGRRTRTISAALRRALRVRDVGICTFPGCTNRIVDAHHLHHWVNGGPTTLSNMTSLCRTHHVLVHEGGYRVELGDNGPRFFRPDGRAVPARPPTGDRVAPLPLLNPETMLGHACAGRIDLGWIVEATLTAHG